MKKNLLLKLLLLLTIIFPAILLPAQNGENSSRGTTLKNELPNNRLLQIDQSIVNNLYSSLQERVLKTGHAETLILSPLEIQKYIQIFDNDLASFKEVDRKVAMQRIEAEVDNAEAKLSTINHSKNITLIDSETFYGDDSKLSKIVSFKVDIVDKNDKPKFFEIIFVEINGAFKVLAVNS